MNYNRIYNCLIAKAVNRCWTKESASQYVERHHIIPKCKGGTDDEYNLVYLTAKEHFVAHHLLWKAYKTHKLAYAFRAMTRDPHGNRYYNARLFEVAKSAASEAASARWQGSQNPNANGITEDHRAKLSSAKKGTSLSATHRANISKGNTGKTISVETRAKMSKSQTGKKHSKETKEKLSANNIAGITGMLGRNHSQSAKDKMSATMKGRPQKQVTCPHCNKTGGASNMGRYHFDNCKFKS